MYISWLNNLNSHDISVIAARCIHYSIHLGVQLLRLSFDSYQRRKLRDTELAVSAVRVAKTCPLSRRSVCRCGRQGSPVVARGRKGVFEGSDLPSTRLDCEISIVNLYFGWWGKKLFNFTFKFQMSYIYRHLSPLPLREGSRYT